MMLFSTAYLPCISYLARFLADDSPCIEIYETYHKQTYRNRCRVMTANGVESLSVPVIKVNGNHTMTKDVAISYKEHWQQIHRRCLESAYKASPYFDHYFAYLKPIFETRFERLIDLNDAALQAVLKMLKANKEIVHTTDYVKEIDNDLREAFSPKNQPDSNAFPKYYQVFSTKFPFTPDLSVLDLIFNEGPGSITFLTNAPKGQQAPSPGQRPGLGAFGLSGRHLSG
jgi:succinate dehydrogenase flavin-adding protein (antitoxin of CptAB toxin-antitoxin module)